MQYLHWSHTHQVSVKNCNIQDIASGSRANVAEREQIREFTEHANNEVGVFKECS